MCYRCSVCKANVGPSVNLSRHVIYREVTILGRTLVEIAKELPVCKPCKQFLDAGLTIKMVKNFRCPKSAVPVNLAPAVTPALQAESVF